MPQILASGRGGCRAAGDATFDDGATMSDTADHGTRATNDVLSRILAENMRGSLGQPLVIENISGAGGSIGTRRIARAIPDGCTLGVGSSSTHVLNGAIYRLDYDIQKDFEPRSAANWRQTRPTGK